MGDIVHTVYGTLKDDERSGVFIDAKILGELIEGPLNKRAVYAEDRLASAGCNTGRECNGSLFGNTYINKLAAGFLSFLFCKNQ